MSIPKKIHYCWFGGAEKSEKVKKYLDTWKKLDKYEIIEWNESNFDISSNKFVKFAYDNKKWAFVSDYVRLKVLQEYGGIYLDTDVEIIKDFDKLLENKMFLGFIYDSSIGTAVIGSIPNHNIINKLLLMYDEARFSCKDNKMKFIFKGYEDYQINNNNDLFTVVLLKEFDNFILNNKEQKFNDVTIYPKEYFERRTFNSRINYSIHHCYGSWYKDNPEKRSNIAKVINFFIGDILYDKLQCKIKNKKLPYYKYTR